MQCRSLVAQLGRNYNDFQAANTQIIIILGSDVEHGRKYASDLKLPFPVLADPEREIYHRYGLHKVIGLIQRTAAVIIDKDGVIQYIKIVTNPMTWLFDYQELFQAVQQVNLSAKERQ